MAFEFRALGLDGAFLIVPKAFEDDRGFFAETFREEEFRKNGIEMRIVQENHSKSRRGVLRGLHFQRRPFGQAKLVRCVRGEIFDAIVDIREGSKTFGMYESAILSEKNMKMLYVPRGFAHGYLALSEESEIIYCVDSEYSKESESGILWNDKSIGIPWPTQNPILSEKDRSWPSLGDVWQDRK